MTEAELEAFAATLPAPHRWTYSAGAFRCWVCLDSFEPAEPMPEGPCAAVMIDADGVHLRRFDFWKLLDAFIACHGRAAAEQQLARAGLRLNPAYPPDLPMVFVTEGIFGCADDA